MYNNQNQQYHLSGLDPLRCLLVTVRHFAVPPSPVAAIHFLPPYLGPTYIMVYVFFFFKIYFMYLVIH